MMRRRKFLCDENLPFSLKDSFRDVRNKYETEFQRLRMLNSRLESDLHELRPQLTSAGNNSEVSPGAVLSAMTKSLARKINSTMSTSNDSLHNIEEEKQQQQLKAATASKYVNDYNNT
jgi:type II secretory pathway component PulM